MGKFLEKKCIVLRYQILLVLLQNLSRLENFYLRSKKNLVLQKSVVVEGRDIGTVVFPDANVKFFLSADLDIRTTRRNRQIEENNILFDTKKVEGNLIKRDKTDSERKIAPLKKPKDAFEIDTSKKSELEVFNIAKNYIDSNLEF